MDCDGLLDIMIARLPGLSFPDRILLCEAFSDESDLIRASKTDIESILKRRLVDFWDINMIRSFAENEEKTARLRGINRVSWYSPAYPPLLREIYDPPPLLYFRGKLPNPENPLVAIVGTRKPSPHAASQAYSIARGLGYGGLSVVSGLALGIDAVAHRGNIDGGMPTYVVLGSGADEVYPSSNRLLARRVLETGGGLITEYPPGTGPRKWNFPARNRIISGMARGVLIVEAPRRSGALITARFALDQGRELWVASEGIAPRGNIPIGLLFDRRGTEKLAGEGAPVIYSAAGIFKAWNMDVSKRGVSEGDPTPSGRFIKNTEEAVNSLAQTLGVEIGAKI